MENANASRKTAETFQQLTLAQQQTEALSQALDLQKEIAVIDKGRAKIRVDVIAVTREEKDRARVGIVVTNDGKRAGRNISICATTEFRNDAPVDRGCDKSKFRPVGCPDGGSPVESLAPIRKPDGGKLPTVGDAAQLQIAREEGARNLYVWGLIRYDFFATLVATEPFCVYIPAKPIVEGAPKYWAERGQPTEAKQCDPQRPTA